MRQIFTIGYEGAAVEDLLDLLVGTGVEILIDVRAVALSRRPGFSKTKLAANARRRGLEYVHLRNLGDPKSGREAARRGDLAGFRHIYSTHLQTSEAKTALDDLAKLAAGHIVCLLCFERNAADCHRSMIVDRLCESRRLGVVNLQAECLARVSLRTLCDPDQGGATLRA